MEVHGGDHPLPNGDTVSVTAVLAGVTEVPRIEALQRTAVDADSPISEREVRRGDELRARLADENDELDPPICGDRSTASVQPGLPRPQRRRARSKNQPVREQSVTPLAD